MRRLNGRAPGLEPAQCLVIEDSTTGIAAGLAAGMKVLAVTNSYPAAKLSAAHRVVDSLAGLDTAGLRQLFAA
jgi:beta-phosphoglucomutase